nr:hypothetical protein [Tanacetum cinerariifolium]
MRPFGYPVTILNTLDPLGSGPPWLFDINTLIKTMNYQPVIAGNQSNPIVGVQEQFDAEKAGEESVQQYVLFPIRFFGSINPHNTDDDAAFGGKKPEFEGRKPESEVHVSPSTSAKTKNHDDKTKREAKAKIPAVGQIFTNNTNNFSDAGLFNTAISPTHRKSSYVNTSQYLNDPNMPKLEDITYTDDEEDAGAEADFTNLETTITKLNDVTRLQALVDKKKVIITEATIQDALRLNDAESIDCLPNEEIFTELSRMGYEKPSTKLTFFKEFFSPQWKAQVGDLSLHSTKYSSPALTQKVFYNIRRVGKGFSRVDTPLFEGMIVAQHDDDVADEGATSVPINDVPADVDEPSIPSPTPTTQPPQYLPSTLQGRIIANMDADEDVTLKDVADIAKEVVVDAEIEESAYDDEVEPVKLQEVVEVVTNAKHMTEEGIITNIDVDEEVNLKDVTAVEKTAEIEENADVQGRQAESQAQIYQTDLEHADKVLSMQDDELEPAKLKEVVEVVTNAKLMAEVGRQADPQAKIYQIDVEHADKVLGMQDDEVEPVKLQEVMEVVTTAKHMTEVVTTGSATITAAATPITAAVITTTSSAARKRKGVVIRDLEETATPSIIINSEPKSKEKGKEIMVEEPKPLKKQAHIEQDEAYARELEAELNRTINWDDVIDQAQRKEKEDNVVMRNMAGFKMDYFKGMSYDDIQKAAEKQKLDEEVEELKRHLQIVPNNEDDVYTEATLLAHKVHVVDYEIYIENNKPYYKIISADESLQLFLSFLSLLRNFDREDLEVLWELVTERFASSKPKNFSNDFLLTTLTYMFEKPDVQAQIRKNQRIVHGLAKTYCRQYKLMLLNDAAVLRLLEQSAAVG